MTIPLFVCFLGAAVALWSEAPNVDKLRRLQVCLSVLHVSPSLVSDLFLVTECFATDRGTAAESTTAK